MAPCKLHKEAVCTAKGKAGNKKNPFVLIP